MCFNLTVETAYVQHTVVSTSSNTTRCTITEFGHLFLQIFTVGRVMLQYLERYSDSAAVLTLPDVYDQIR